MEFHELDGLVSNVFNDTKVSGEAAAIGIKDFGRMLNKYNNLSDKEKKQFLVDSFTDPKNKEECKEFALRHPECKFNKFILK
jgi:hypothetical protein